MKKRASRCSVRLHVCRRGTRPLGFWPMFVGSCPAMRTNQVGKAPSWCVERGCRGGGIAMLREVRVRALLAQPTARKHSGAQGEGPSRSCEACSRHRVERQPLSARHPSLPPGSRPHGVARLPGCAPRTEERLATRGVGSLPGACAARRTFRRSSATELHEVVCSKNASVKCCKLASRTTMRPLLDGSSSLTSASCRRMVIAFLDVDSRCTAQRSLHRC